MGGMSSTEQETVERAAAEPMREQVLAWSAHQQRVAQPRWTGEHGRHRSPTPSQLCRASLGSKIPHRSKLSTPRGGPSTSSTASICI